MKKNGNCKVGWDVLVCAEWSAFCGCLNKATPATYSS